MTLDDIIRMAQQCWPSGPKDIWAADMHLPRLERFAALVAAAEREACAKVCDDQHISLYEHGLPIIAHGARLTAIAIRARGEP